MLAPRTSALPSTPVPDARQAARAFDRHWMAQLAPATSGLSPISLGLAWMDWAQHLAWQPAQCLRLAAQAQAGCIEWLGTLVTTGEARPAIRSDARFAAPVWQQWPWAGMVHAYQQAEDWWRDAAQLDGLTPHHQEMVRAFARQWLDMASPSNSPLNPEVGQATFNSAGANLAQGARNWLDDWRKEKGLEPLQPSEHAYLPGVDLATTPGAVVYRNRLVELIQYAPTTDTVQAEPVFIVPSWIMKYYILDLSEHNSMVRWLVSRGHTVFILSWKNPDESDADIGFNDYLQWGVFDTLAAVARLVPGQPVHACGYCLGGTLLAMAAAAMSRAEPLACASALPRLASVTLLAAEVDFQEPGELGILVDESQVQLLEAMMGERGFLSGRQMAGSFQFLHSRDLVWSTRMREYLLGQRSQPNDLMSWNADVTRMPARMHSEYLRRCYLRNEIADGRYLVEDEPISLTDIRQPIFAVGTEKDHVSPWPSVYKLHRLTKTDLTFVLTSGGHNAGIVSEPGHAGRRYRQHTTKVGDHWLAPETWAKRARAHEGSWWVSWDHWMKSHSQGTVPARAIDEAVRLDDAPGRYVHVRYHD